MKIRVKVALASVAVILLANLMLGLVTMRYLGNVWMKEVQRRVDLDLNSARAAYRGHAEKILSFLQAASLHRVIATGAGRERPEELADRLDSLLERGEMDILFLVDTNGRVVYRARHPRMADDDQSANPLIAAVRQTGLPAIGTIILAKESLEREGVGLAKRAHFELLQTPAAKRTDVSSRPEGMVLGAAAPVIRSTGELVGVLFAGDLLNRRYEIVDAIRDEVFANEQYGGHPIGTVTIFQSDLRISTNVETESGQRAVGTRLSATVYDQVLQRGERWGDRAFVVNDWYITAYEPIRDPSDKIIGALYVGLLESPFEHRKQVVQLSFLGIVTAMTVVSLVFLYVVTRLVLYPIGRVSDMCRRVVGGDLTARVGIRPPGEMGGLCASVDAMADAAYQRERELKTATQHQIGQSEKLALIGRLAAGVAHEINNPLTGVLTFAHLLKNKDHMTGQDRHDLDLIINETSRVAEIVRGLLDFAREREAAKELLDLNEVIRRTIRLVKGQNQFNQIEIVEELDETLPQISGNVNQLQQVLLNLSLNACEAMPDGGVMTVRTLVCGDRVVLEVHDTGCGIRQEDIERVFEPFYSTKPVGKGTGLGLSVSYGIIEQHGGGIDAESRFGEGTTFSIALPAFNMKQRSE